MTPILRTVGCMALLLVSAASYGQSPTQATAGAADNSTNERTRPAAYTSTAPLRAGAGQTSTATGLEIAGLQLAMGKDSARTTIPALQFHLESTTQGLEVGTLSCGLQIQGNPALRPTPCNFKWDGTDVLNLSLQYWGDRMVRINLLFNNYRLSNAQGELARVVDRISKRYGPPTANTEWKNGTERLWVEGSLRASSAMDILVLEETSLAQTLNEAIRTEEAAQVSQWRQQRNRRSVPAPGGQMPAPNPAPQTSLNLP